MSFINQIYKSILRKSSVFIILFVIIDFSVDCQNKKITFQSLQEGLSHHQIRCILKDSKGFMWFGTQDGLNKYNGTNFVIYENNPYDSMSICHNSINAIIEDRFQNIWIGTSNGINIYNRDKDNFSTIKEFGKRDILYVDALFYDSNDILWIGTLGNGLFLYNRKNSELISYTHNNKDSGSVGSNFINCIISDNDKNIWIGTRNGLDLFNYKDKTFTHFKKNNQDPENLGNNNISSLISDKEGNIWIGTYGGGVNKILKKNGKYIFKHFQKSDKPGSISHNNILSLCFDHKGNLWIGTENGGLNCLYYKSDKFSNFYSEDGNQKSLSSNSIWSIYEDNIGILWIGTYNKGLNIIDKKYEKFEHIQRNGSADKTLVNNNVKSFAEDDKGNLWIATDGGGLSCFDTKKRQFINCPDNSQLSSKAVMSICIDPMQNIWVGTWTGGIDRFNKYGIKVKNYRNVMGLGPGNNIMSIYMDRSCNIWAGSMGGGLFVYNSVSDSFILVADNEKTSHLDNESYINDILEDSENNIWIGTQYGLVCIKRAGERYKFIEYLHTSNPKSISSFRISILFEDSRKNLWIGTEDGLNLFNKQDKSFSIFQKQHGLPNNSIKGILEDNNGNLWISTNQGISKFNYSDTTFKNFTKEDGLNSNEFNLRACIKTSSGEFFFGGNNGMNAFYPDSVKLNTYIPPVYITNFKIFNNPVKIGAKDSPLQKHITETRKITLTYKQSSFTIEFVALNYTRSVKNQYAFILEGFDKNWNYVGNRNLATYTNLNPGKYVFKVKGSNNDGLWNNSPTKLEITVLPPYWITTWAYLLYFLVFSIVLIGFIRLLVIRAKQAQKLKLEKISHEKDEELNKLKIQFFTNVSHELKTPLCLIISPLEQIISFEQVKGELKNQLQMVLRNVKKLFRLVNEIMDFTKSEESLLKMSVQMNDIINFTHEIYYLFVDEAQRRQIDYQFIAETDKINIWFDKNKMEKIIVNLISNAFKYTPDQGRIHIKIGKTKTENNCDTVHNNKFNVMSNECVKISIIDNGPGISPKYLDKVFDRFFQTPENNANSQTGTGIGLALVKNLVDLHHGNISVKSEKWEETCFTVILPLGNSQFKENEIIAEPVDNNLSSSVTAYLPDQNMSEHNEPLAQKAIILIVEDNIELCDYIVSILSKKYKTLKAPDGEVGYEIASDQIPDLIISDILMPKLTGIGLCKKIKENILTSHIPFMLLTSKSTIEDQIEGIETGADVYITKPFNFQYLEATIKNLIETRQKLFQRFSQDVYILPKELTGNKQDEYFLEKAIQFIDSNILNKNLSVEEISSHLLLSQSQTYRKIKALTGQSVIEFINTIRLKKAIKLFESREYNISEVAYKVGFNSPAYFTKCFRNQFGKSPSEYFADQKTPSENHE